MIQSMEILQLPIMALQERIEQEMEENPMLEVSDGDETLPDEEGESDESTVTTCYTNLPSWTSTTMSNGSRNGSFRAWTLGMAAISNRR